MQVVRLRLLRNTTHLCRPKSENIRIRLHHWMLNALLVLYAHYKSMEFAANLPFLSTETSPSLFVSFLICSNVSITYRLICLSNTVAQSVVVTDKHRQRVYWQVENDIQWKWDFLISYVQQYQYVLFNYSSIIRM